MTLNVQLHNLALRQFKVQFPLFQIFMVGGGAPGVAKPLLSYKSTWLRLGNCSLNSTKMLHLQFLGINNLIFLAGLPSFLSFYCYKPSLFYAKVAEPGVFQLSKASSIISFFLNLSISSNYITPSFSSQNTSQFFFP